MGPIPHRTSGPTFRPARPQALDRHRLTLQGNPPVARVVMDGILEPLKSLQKLVAPKKPGDVRMLPARTASAPFGGGFPLARFIFYFIAPSHILVSLYCCGLRLRAGKTFISGADLGAMFHSPEAAGGSSAAAADSGAVRMVGGCKRAEQSIAKQVLKY